MFIYSEFCIQQNICILSTDKCFNISLSTQTAGKDDNFERNNSNNDDFMLKVLGLTWSQRYIRNSWLDRFMIGSAVSPYQRQQSAIVYLLEQNT